jgi:hypothetical protein
MERRAGPRTRAADVGRVGVCDRIDQLATEFAEHPPVFSAAVEAGILAAVDREE